MKICVQGLWHLGTVTSACLAAAGHDVTGLDDSSENIRLLQLGKPPLFEPGLDDLIASCISDRRLQFTDDVRSAVQQADAVWIAFDTPVDEEDRADVDSIVREAASVYPHVRDGAVIIVSSQVSVGTTRRMEAEFAKASSGRTAHFAYSPENLRLGKAIASFTDPDRVVVGARTDAARSRIREILAPITDRIEWMSVESAEMTKHALNAFLSTSVAFINEIAVICEAVGADAKEVERALRSEKRIGPKAYLSPGAAFSGGTLARDVSSLLEVGRNTGSVTPLLEGVRASNTAHLAWPRNRLRQALGELRGKVVAIWGLTYKPGTDTLRRSAAVELCRWLAQQGVTVRAHDPVVRSLPGELAGLVHLCETPIEAVSEASALVLCTEWPEYRAVPSESVARAMRQPIVIDASRFLDESIGRDPRFRYLSVGRAA